MSSASDCQVGQATDSVGETETGQLEQPGHQVSESRTLAMAATILLAVAVVYLVQALSYPLGSLAQPGPGLFPLGIGVLFTLASLALIVEALRMPKDATIRWPHASYAIRLVLVLVASVAYLLLLPLTGQFIASAVLCAALLVSMRSRRWWLTVILSICFSASLQYLFGTLLNVPLPRGPFNF